MNIKRHVVCLVIAACALTGCVRYAIHGEGVFKDSDGITITNCLYRTETKRTLWFDSTIGNPVWLVTKGRPHAQLQFDKVEGIEPLAAEVQRNTATQVIESAYSVETAGSEAIAGVINNCNSVCSFTGGVAKVSILTKYSAGWGSVSGFSHAYLAPREAPYEFSIERHKLKEDAVPEWVRREIVRKKK